MAPTYPLTLYHLSAIKGRDTFLSLLLDILFLISANIRTVHFVYLCFIMTDFSCCSQKLLRSPRKPTRKISKIPFKVLDAPELQDDFYLNLVDWSSLNVLSVGLGTCVYLWSACTSQVVHSVYSFWKMNLNCLICMYICKNIFLRSIYYDDMPQWICTVFSPGNKVVWFISRGRLCHVSWVVWKGKYT